YPAFGNAVQGNYIGTDKTGTAPLGTAVGIRLDGTNNNTIGGTTAGAGNTIAYNTNYGILVDSGTGNSFLGNSIFSNGGCGSFLNSANNANDNLAAPLLTPLSTSSNPP